MGSQPLRGPDVAKEMAVRRPKFAKKPTVIEAAIDLGRCLDSTTKASTDLLAVAYQSLVESMADSTARLSRNGADRRMPRLDFAVVKRLLAISSRKVVKADILIGGLGRARSHLSRGRILVFAFPLGTALVKTMFHQNGQSSLSATSGSSSVGFL